VVESAQAVLRFVVFNLRLRIVRRAWRTLRRIPLVRPYVMVWGVYRALVSPSKRVLRVNLKRGESLLVERKR
jgi:hypothetical protein